MAVRLLESGISPGSDRVTGPCLSFLMAGVGWAAHPGGGDTGAWQALRLSNMVAHVDSRRYDGERNGMEPGIDVLFRGLIAIAVLALAAVGYNWLIAHYGKHGYLDGYTALAVAFGCFGVLLVALWVVWPFGPVARIAVAITAGLFVPAGVPMILGSIGRHVRARAQERRRMEAEALRSVQ